VIIFVNTIFIKKLKLNITRFIGFLIFYRNLLDFIIGLLFYKNFNSNNFDNIFIIIYYYLKIIKYISYYKIINIFELITLL